MDILGEVLQTARKASLTPRRSRSIAHACNCLSDTGNTCPLWTSRPDCLTLSCFQENFNGLREDRSRRSANSHSSTGFGLTVISSAVDLSLGCMRRVRIKWKASGWQRKGLDSTGESRILCISLHRTALTVRRPTPAVTRRRCGSRKSRSTREASSGRALGRLE